MAEQIVEYQIGADAEALKRAMADAEAAAQKLGKSIGNALAKGGADGTRDLGQSLDRGLDDAGRRSSRTAQAIGTALGRALGVGMVAAAGAAFPQAIEQLKEIDDLAKKTGLSTSRIGALQNVGSSVGVSSSDIRKGLDDLAATANRAAVDSESKLAEYLKANNSSILDREGNLKSTNQLLAEAAGLVQNAKTEYDKIDIARIFGLSERWVKLLEGGPRYLGMAVAEAERLGGAFDNQLVASAAAFDTAWSKAWASFALSAKAVIADAISGIAQLLAAQGGIFDKLDRAFIADQVKRGYPLSGDEADIAKRLFNPGPKLQSAIDEADRRRQSGFRASEIQGVNNPPPDAGLEFTIKAKRRPSTSPNAKSGGTSGGGKSEEDTALGRLENYTLALQRQGDVLAAEIETFGKSNAERKAAVELAKAKNDLDKLDEGTKARVSEQIRQAVAVNEQYRESLDRLKGAQQAANFAADQFADALGDIIVDGKNAEDVLRGLVKNFAKQAISSLFAGNGAFSGLFGQQNGGIFGSLFSGLFGGKFADGGELPRGISLVGERGPELIRNSGNGAARVYPSGITPNGAGGGSTQYVSIDARGADAGAVSRIESALRAMDKQFSARVISVNRQSQVRGIA